MNNKRRLALAVPLTLALALLLIPHGEEWTAQKFEPPKPSPAKKERRYATPEERKENERLAKTYANAAYGWKGSEWKCLQSLWAAESRFSHLSDNPRSSAFGIAQRLREKSKDPAIQILHGLKYIAHRYRTPCRAWEAWGRHGGWY